jgi:glycosyltransferase involved in cell wall biosynthesis
MRIGLDFRLLSAGGLTVHRGTGRYTQQQLREVLRLDRSNEKNNQYVLFCREDADFEALLPEIAAAPNVSIALLPPLEGRAWDELNRPEDVLRSTEELQRAIDAQEVDVFHLTIPAHLRDLVPFRLDGPVVATHYDLIPRIFPGHYLQDSNLRDLYERALGLIRRADRVVAISHHVRREANAYLGIPPERIRVAWPVADPCFRPLPEDERERLLAPWRERLGLPGGFAVTVSHVHHSKNLRTLFDAWALLPAATRRELPLVLACELDAAEVATIRGWARERGIEASLRLTGFVPDEELTALYNAATLYVHPSRYEGFGLPVLEAMRCGTPVVAGNASSLPEVVGDAGALVDPENPAELARAVEALQRDPAARREMGELALARAASFRAEDLGRETLAAYEEAVRAGRGDLGRNAGKPLHLALWSPVPPQESGIADYSAELLREVVRWADVDIYVDDGVPPTPEVAECGAVRLFTAFGRQHRRRPYDAALVQLGASFYHLYMKEALRGSPSLPRIVTLHDLTWGALLFREAALEGEEEAFRRVLEASEGPAAAAEHAAILAGDPAALPGLMEDFLNRHPLLGEVMAASAAQIVHMPRAAEDLRTRYSDQADSRLFYFPMGVEDPRLSLTYTGWNDLRPRLGISAGAFVVAAFGVAHPVKRLDAAVRALGRIAAELPQVEPVLLIVGGFADPAYRKQLESLAAELGAGRALRILGRTSRRDFELALLACDVVVNLRYPFRHQMSATLMRGVAAGRPVLITDVPEWSHFPPSFCLRVVSDEGDEKEVESLAGHLIGLARDPERRRAMGEAARRYWEESATPAHMADGYRRVLEEILGRRIEEPAG